MRVWGWEHLPTDQCGWSHGVGARGGAEVSEGDHTARPSPAHLPLEVRAGPQAGPLAVAGCPEAQRGLGGRLHGGLMQTLQGPGPGGSVLLQPPGTQLSPSPTAGLGPPVPRPGRGSHAELPCPLPPPVPAPAHLTNFCPSLDLSRDRPRQSLPDTSSTPFPGRPLSGGPVLHTPLSGPAPPVLFWSSLDPEPGGHHCRPASPRPARMS